MVVIEKNKVFNLSIFLLWMGHEKKLEDLIVRISCLIDARPYSQANVETVSKVREEGCNLISVLKDSTTRIPLECHEMYAEIADLLVDPENLRWMVFTDITGFRWNKSHYALDAMARKVSAIKKEHLKAYFDRILNYLRKCREIPDFEGYGFWSFVPHNEVDAYLDALVRSGESLLK